MDVTIGSPQSCPLSNLGQIAEMYEFFGDESLGQERDTKTSWNLSVAKHDRRVSEVDQSLQASVSRGTGWTFSVFPPTVSGATGATPFRGLS